MSARAVQTGIRQSARKVRLVVDSIRGKNVNEAYTLLRFSKKRAARQVEKVLRSAVANAEQAAERDSEALDVDTLYVSYAVANEGATLWRWRPAAFGRALPIRKRVSSVEIRVAPKEEH